MMQYLVVGLGNIGKGYKGTRHNAGFMVVDHLATNHDVSFVTCRFGALGKVSLRFHQIHLLKPDTFMNESGQSVCYWLKKLAIPISQLLVVVDDLHLPLGALRLLPQGGTGGHNGLKSIRDGLQHNDYARLRFGIGADFAAGNQSKYVLGAFKTHEKEVLHVAINRATQIVVDFCVKGIEATMDEWN